MLFSHYPIIFFVLNIHVFLLIYHFFVIIDIFTSCVLYLQENIHREDVPGKDAMRKKLLILFICFVTIPIMIIYAVFSHIFNSEAEINYKNMYTANISNAAKIAENYFGESLELSMYPLIEPNLNQFYTADSQQEEFSEIFNTANNILSSSPYIFGGVRSITMLRMDDISLTNSTSYSYSSNISLEDQAEAERLDGKAYWYIQPVKDSCVIYITRLIKSAQDLSQELGYVKISASIQELSNLLKGASVGQNSSYIILTQDFLPILSTEQDKTYLDILKEQKMDTLLKLSQSNTSTLKYKNYFISAKEIERTPFLICSVTKADLIIENSFLNNVLMPVSMLTLVFFILLAVVFSKHITKPMIELKNKMTAISAGDFSVRAQVKGNDEISALAEQFNYMSERLDYLYNKVYQGELELNKAQLIALQSQIRPHFLYNTIDTIYWMSQMGNTKAVSTIASNMSRLFRLTITPDNQNQIPLEKELEHLNCYMEIQKIRYGDSIKFTLEYNERLKNHLVLKLLLQPLVENALTHGLKDREQEMIQVQIYADSRFLYYEIRNNGVPISIPYLDELLASSDNESRGFAIRNIDKRLKLQYGADFGLKYGLDGEFSYFKIHQPLIAAAQESRDNL